MRKGGPLLRELSKHPLLSAGLALALLATSVEAGIEDLVITEIMKNPTQVNDEFGEWFEVYNRGDVAAELDLHAHRGMGVAVVEPGEPGCDFSDGQQRLPQPDSAADANHESRVVVGRPEDQ